MAKAGIHWLAPTSMIGANIAGCLFMLGHHLYYRSIHGHAVADGDFFGLDISQQQANIAIGTAFAFLAKASLVLAISTAFTQMFWHAMTIPLAKHAPTLKRIDAVSSALDNVLEMFNLYTWRSYPLLMLIAGLTWLVPIAAIITPSTLSIRASQVLPLPVSTLRVPNLDFRSISYLAQMPDTKLPSVGTFQNHQPYYYAYNGASNDVLKIVNAVMGDGSILPISPPTANTTWQIRFHGPSLECTNIDAVQTARFGHDFADYLKHNEGLRTGSRKFGYLAWYPAVASNAIAVPVASDRSHTATGSGNVSAAALVDLGSLVPVATEALLNRSSMALELLVFTTSFQSRWSFNAANDTALALRRCQLFNATYDVSFGYAGGTQNISISTARDPTQDPVHSIPGALYKYMDQATDYYLYPCTGPEAGSLRACYNHPELLQTLTYQAILDTFAQKIQGQVYSDLIYSYHENVFGGDGTSIYVESDIMQTKLGQSKDLAYLRQAIGSPTEPTFQTVMEANQTDSDYVGVFTSHIEIDELDLSLSDAIEELFKNLTVSLMSSAALQPNYSSPTAPSPAQVTHHNYHNIYVYSPQNLWLPYGIALGLSTLAVIAGLVANFFNRASYSDSFSTVLRAAHGAQLSTRLRDEDMHGQDPLPEYLGEAKVCLRNVRGEGVTGADRETRNLSKWPMQTVRRVESSLE